jgi:hypothetical protein
MRRASRTPHPSPRRADPAKRDATLAFLTTFLAASAAIGVGMFMGCSSDAEGDSSASSTTGNFTTGTLNPAACRDAFPDGVCQNFASPAETCECEDCAPLAACHDLCADDGSCNYAPGTGEDCSCNDCHTGSANCINTGGVECSSTNPDDDDYNPACTADEVCLCSDCTDDPACGECDSNGVCNPASENCECGDCSGTDACSGGPGPTSSSAGGGDGGNGGAGNGGNGGTPGNGGNGGTPANGGGGNGGA